MKLYVWGTGCAAGDLIDSGLAAERVTAFLDSEARGGSFLGRPVLRPEAADTDGEYLVLVAGRRVAEIARQSAACGIREDRLLFLRDNWTLTDRNTDYGRVRQLLPPALLASLQTPPRAIRPLPPTPGSPLTERDLEGDYVRVRTLELLCAGLGDVPGAAAELGVYRGSFARCINALLPERTLYLFDTFEGFNPAEARGQGGGFVEAHRNTSAETVLRLLPQEYVLQYLDYFYGEEGHMAANFGVEGDTYEMVNGKPRYTDKILNNETYPYVCALFKFCIYEGPFALDVQRYYMAFNDRQAEAVERWEAERGRLRTVPLCDVNGTLAILV